MIKEYELKPLNTEGKIYLGIPRERVYIPAFVDNRDQILMSMQKAGRAAGYFQAEGSRIDRNRDRIVDQFLSLPDKPDWLQMLDSDMDHPHDIAMRLSKWGKPIIGGLYFHRGSHHEPFIYSEAEPAKDNYGRTIKLWKSEKDLVYQFLTENNVPMYDGGIVIDNCKNSPLVECDAIATGMMMIHRSVLETMQKPIFEFRGLGAGEDLQFCWEAKHDYGIPIYCDLSTIAGHYTWVPQGQAQFRSIYLNRGLVFSGYTKRESIEWLSEFLGISEEEATEKIEKGSIVMVSDFWRAKFREFGKKPVSTEEVEAFYKDPYTGQLYLIELLYWNFSQAFYNIKSLFVGLRNKKVLEIGSGIGSIAIQLAVQDCDVTAAEINPFLVEFSKYRVKKIMPSIVGKIGNIDFVTNEWESAEDDTYDAIVSVDCFEHIHADTLQIMLKNFARVIKPGGDLIYHATFGLQDTYPMHYDHSEMWDTWLLNAGFAPVSPTHAIRMV